MLKASDIMTRDVLTVSPETGIFEAAGLLLEHHINGLPVVDQDRKLVGIICQNDLIIQQKKIPLPSLFTILDGVFPLTSYKSIEKDIQKITAVTVAQAMTADPITVGPETSLEEIATLMVTNNIHSLPVVENGSLIGIVGKEDILRTLMPAEKNNED